MTDQLDCLACGNRMETKIGSYRKQTVRPTKPYCANPDCKLFNKKKKLWFDE